MAHIYRLNNKNVLFIRIPKTGSQSMLLTLKKYNIDKQFPKNEIKHSSYLEVKEMLGNNFKKIDFVFSCIRNPWAWRNSMYFYIRSIPKKGELLKEYNIIKNMNFNQYIKWLEHCKPEEVTEHKINNKPTHLFLREQSEYLLNENNNFSSINYILKLEDIQNEFKKMMNILGIKNISFNKHIGKSSPCSYIKNYNNITKQIIMKLHKKDISLLKYTFNNK